MVAVKRQAPRPGRFDDYIINRRARRVFNNVALARAAMFAELGLGGQSGLDRPGRDLDKECGYPLKATVRTYRRLYHREGIARRVNDVFSDECWTSNPALYETEDARRTKFERAWDDLARKFNIWAVLHRADRLSGIGRFGIMLLGFDDGRKLDQPVAGVAKDGGKSKKRPKKQVNLLYVRTFSEDSIRIAETDDDQNSPRYGQPTVYELQFSDPTTSESNATVNANVHWTRVIHLAEHREESEVFAVPRMQPVLNRLLDLRKILGGSAEMFWKGAFPGYSFETVPELLGESSMNEDTLRDQVYEYMEGLKRYLALDGVTAKPLLPQTADPTNHVAQQIAVICATLGVPVPVFLGQQLGNLASVQNANDWYRRVSARQQMYLEPYVIRPLVDRLIAVGVLPEPPEGYIVAWRDLNTASDKDKADVSLKKAQAMMQYVTGKCEAIMAPKTFFTLILGMTAEEADAAIKEKEAQTTTFTDPLGEQAAQRETDNQIKIAKATPKPVAGMNGAASRVGPQGGGRIGNPPSRSAGRPRGVVARA